jgi:hypothetical protein
MNEAEKQPYRQFVENWMRAGPELERVRRDELRALDTRKEVLGMDALVDIALRHGAERTTSGLVEMQRWHLDFARRQGLVPPAVAEPPAEYRAKLSPSHPEP